VKYFYLLHGSRAHLRNTIRSTRSSSGIWLFTWSVSQDIVVITLKRNNTQIKKLNMGFLSLSRQMLA
jgi:hypothetical protein